jgi:hypothetical protein
VHMEFKLWIPVRLWQIIGFNHLLLCWMELIVFVINSLPCYPNILGQYFFLLIQLIHMNFTMMNTIPHVYKW